MLLTLNLFCNLLLFALVISQEADQRCGKDKSWHPFADEKCYKIIDALVTKEDAAKICAAETNNPYEMSVPGYAKSLEEHLFLLNLIQDELTTADNVWLGALRTNTNGFQWDDGKPFEFTNWKIGSPSNDSGKACVQIESPLSLPSKPKTDGVWKDVSCLKRNVVLCEKLQTLPLMRIQKLLLETRKTMKDLQSSLQEAHRNVKELENNPVPIGFIYVELPNRPNPTTLWPKVTWKDVTSDYSGLFFRAAGGGSLPIGQVQSDNSPRIIQATHIRTDSWTASADIPYPGQSFQVLTGDVTGHQDICLFFKTSGGEVRPKNTAVRLWQRIK